MRIKSGLLLLLFIAAINVAFADSAIVRRNNTSGGSAIQSVNYKRQSAMPGTYYLEVMEPAVKELEAKIKQEPYNYPLYANIVNVYMQAQQYNSAFNYLELLYKLKTKDKLDNITISMINKMFTNYKKTSKKDSALNYDLALMALITDNENAIDYVIAGAEHSHNSDIAKQALDLVSSSNYNPQKAIELCDKILQKNGKDIEVRRIKAICHEKLNQTREAIGEYIKILALNSADNNSRYSLYKLLAKYGNIGDKEMLKRLYETSEDINQEQALSSLTELLIKHGDFEDAKYYASVLTKKYSQNPEGYIMMSEIYNREGKIKDAYDVLSLARDKADNNETIAKYNVMLAKLSDEPVKEANELIGNGLYNQALEVLASANPESLYVILTQARANYLLNNKNAAFEYLNKAMSLYPDNSDVYCAFGYIYLQEHDSETARNYVNQSLKIDKDNRTAQDLLDLVNKSDSNKYITTIQNAMEAQNYQEAMRLVDEAIAIDNKSADLYYYKSLINISLNNYRAAAVNLHECLDLDRNYTEAYFYLAASYDNINDRETALIYYKKFLEIADKNAIGDSEKIEYAKNRMSKIENL